MPLYFLPICNKNMENGQDEKLKEAWWRPAVALFLRLSSWVAAPVVIGTFLGRYLDKRFDSEPIMLIGVVSFSFLISMYGLIKETMKEYRKIAKTAKKEKQEAENLDKENN